MENIHIHIKSLISELRIEAHPCSCHSNSGLSDKQLNIIESQVSEAVSKGIINAMKQEEVNTEDLVYKIFQRVLRDFDAPNT